MCVAHDSKSVLFAETWGCRVSRYWLEGPKAGTTEIVIADLPGYPDNINRGSRGTYWVALAGHAHAELRSGDDHAGVPSPHGARAWPATNGCFPMSMSAASCNSTRTAASWNRCGTCKGDNHPAITSMREHRGYLYLGGVTNNRIGRIKLADADPNWTGRNSYWGERQMIPLKKALDRWLGRGEASITTPPMDGAFRPNDLLDAADGDPRGAGARWLGGHIAGPRCFLRSARCLRVEKPGARAGRDLSTPRSARSPGLPDGGAAAASIDGRIVFVGGRYAGKTIAASAGGPVHHRAGACARRRAARRQRLGDPTGRPIGSAT